MEACTLIVFPYSPVDQELAAKLSKWISDLGKNEGHRVLIVRDDRCNPNYDSEIKHNLEKVFDSSETISVVERIDGWPLAPNLIFRYAAKHIQMTKPTPWLWIEADAVPLKSGWVDALSKEYDAEPRKPFLGDFVNVPDVIPHCSGLAIYPPVIIDHAPSAVHAREIAWDCWAADEIVPKMKQTQLIKHRWKHPKFNNQSEVDNLLEQLGDAVLFHADKSGTLISFLRERKYPKPAILPQTTNQNACTVNLGAGIGSVDAFIKTFPKDYPWLEWCLRSIDKFAGGLRKVILVSDNVLPEEFSIHAATVNHRIEREYGNDNYLSQQVFKMHADTYTDANHILHLDSDTIFTRPVTPETYFRDGKPIIMITPIEQAHPDEQNAWRRVMHKFMGKPSQYEFMRRFPIVYPRWAYGALREFCLKQHEVELDKYIMAQPYREFSEFNVMGFFLHEFHRDKFTWIDTSKIPESEWPELTVDQQWSHNPIPVEKWEKTLSEQGYRQAASVTEVEKPNAIAPISSVENSDARSKAIVKEYPHGIYISDPDCKGITWYDPHPIRYEEKDGKLIRVEPVSSIEKHERNGEKEKTLASKHGLKKTDTETVSESPKLRRQNILEKLRANAAKARAAKAAKKAKPVSSQNNQPRLQEKTEKVLIEELAQYFTNPLAKGRIIKRLKNAPITPSRRA